MNSSKKFIFPNSIPVQEFIESDFKYFSNRKLNKDFKIDIIIDMLSKIGVGYRQEDLGYHAGFYLPFEDVVMTHIGNAGLITSILTKPYMKEPFNDFLTRFMKDFINILKFIGFNADVNAYNSKKNIVFTIEKPKFFALLDMRSINEINVEISMPVYKITHQMVDVKLKIVFDGESHFKRSLDGIELVVNYNSYDDFFLKFINANKNSFVNKLDIGSDASSSQIFEMYGMYTY